MILQYSSFIIPLLVSAAITGTLALMSLKRRNDPVIPPFILLMCATTVWTTCYALQLASADLASNLLLTDILYPAIVTVPVAWLLVILRYTGNDHVMSPRNIALLFIEPAFAVIFVVTNPYHYLYYTAYTSGMLEGAIVWNFEHGPLFWIHAGYSYLCIGVSFVLIVLWFFKSPAIYRKQTVLLAFAAGIPLLANLMYVSGHNPFPGIDITPFMFTLTGTLMALGIFRFRLFSLAPVAYPVIFTTIEDAIIVLDRHDRISELNPAAKKIIRNTGRSPVGEPVTELLPPDLIASLVCDDSGKATVLHAALTGNDGILRDYEVTCREIKARARGYNGRLVMFRDETEKLKARQAIEMTNRKLNLLSSITRHDMQNKLTTLGGYIELAKAEKDEAALHSYLSSMEKTTRVFQQELEFTRDYQDLGVQAPSWQGVAAMIREKESHLPTQDVRIERAIQPGTLEIYADPLLGKVFYNLIDNALRYGGERMTEIHITSREERDALVLVFEDNGIGIPAKDKERLFTKGFGRNTGLGLFLSREILAITGITITENGEPGKGARFEITVPRGTYRS
jgi:signal transduction histidine kinase